MNAIFSGKLAIGSIIAAAAFAMIPLMAQADNAQSAEIASLKQQIYTCHHHKRHHITTSRRIEKQIVLEKQTIIEKPVIVEKVVEKQVVVEKQGDLILERPMEVERKVVVAHAAHHRHLLHIGIPLIGVNLF